MKKMVVLICGTNCSGKTSTSYKLLEKLGGGIGSTSEKKLHVFSADGRIATINADYTRTTTRVVPPMARELFEKYDIVIVEGMYLSTFGQQALDVLFAGDCAVHVTLYAPLGELLRRRKETRPKGGGCIHYIGKKNKEVLRIPKKMSAIGVPSMLFDTSQVSVEEIATAIANKVNEILCTTND